MKVMKGFIINRMLILRMENAQFKIKQDLEYYYPEGSCKFILDPNSRGKKNWIKILLEWKKIR